MKKGFFLALFLFFFLRSWSQIDVPYMDDLRYDDIKSAKAMVAWFPKTLNGYDHAQYEQALKNSWKLQPVKIVDSVTFDSLLYITHNTDYLYLTPEFSDFVDHPVSFEKDDEFTFRLYVVPVHDNYRFATIMADQTTKEDGGQNITPELLGNYLTAIQYLLHDGESITKAEPYYDSSIVNLPKSPFYLPDYMLSYMDYKVPKEDPALRSKVLMSETDLKYVVAKQSAIDSLIRVHAPGYFMQFVRCQNLYYFAIYHIADSRLVYESVAASKLSPMLPAQMEDRIDALVKEDSKK